MLISRKEARIHNLLNRLLKEKVNLKNEITKDYLSSSLYFRKQDFVYMIEEELFIQEESGKFKTTDKLMERLDEWKKKVRSDQNLPTKEKKFINEFEQLKSTKKYVDESAINLACEIHWNRLPEYEEYMIVNREEYPNEDTKEYYNHYHALEDLYNEIKDNGKNVNSVLGDCNLDMEIQVPIYTRRWGNDDNYTITRTVNGWDVDFFGKKSGGKNGEALIKTLEHDSVIYPVALPRFMEDLWILADENEMSKEELEIYLNKIAKWISNCEHGTPEGIER